MNNIINKENLKQQLHDSDKSALNRYMEKCIGKKDLMLLFKYELINLITGNFSGGGGYLLRKWFYPALLNKCGYNSIFGKNITIRHPYKVQFGDCISIDDGTLIDASGTDLEGIHIGNDVIISRNCLIQAKTGNVFIDDRSDIGCNVVISSVSGITIGKSVLIAANTSIGGARYKHFLNGIPMMDQGVYSKGPIEIEDDVWIGTNAIVLDGVKLGKGCIVGAGSVITKNVPQNAIVAGVPAFVLKYRHEETSGFKLE